MQTLLPELRFAFRQLRKNPGFTAVAVLASFGSLAEGAETNFTVRPLSLKDCIQIALEHNLDVKIERFTPEIARYDLNLAYATYEPVARGSAIHQSSFEHAVPGSTNAAGTTTKNDSFIAGIIGTLPTGLTYELGGDVANTRTTEGTGRLEDSRGSASIQLRQPLLKNFWIDASRLNIQVNKKLLGISELGLRQQIMITVTSVELAYYDLKLARQNVRVQEQALVLAGELLAANRHRVEQGVLAPLDEKQAESQVASQRAILLVAQRLLAAQQNVLKGLLSDKMAEWQDVLVEPVDEIPAPQIALDRQSSWQKGLTLRPEFQNVAQPFEVQPRLLEIITAHEIELGIKLVAAGFGGAGREYAGVFGDIRRGLSPAYSYGATLTIPLGNRAARNNFKISKAEQQQALVKLQRLEQNIMLQIEDTVKLAQTNFERAGATREARTFAEAALEAEQTKLENGRSTSFFVLQLQRDLTAARSAEIQALAQLALREGSVFERNNLNLVPPSPQ
jgi:outer membrane protein TolC